MEIKNTDYPIFANYKISDIPRDRLAGILDELSALAMFQMNSLLKGDVLKPTIETIVTIIKDKFAHYPLHLITHAFDQGSLGELGGTSSFNVRNVYIWLSAVKENYNRLTAEQWSKEETRRKITEEKTWKETGGGDAIFGTAVSLKLSWVYAGRIHPDNWELYTLDDIVRLLRNGETVQSIKPQMIRG
jgi:hypothetical protein